jgi:hypothetical protein
MEITQEIIDTINSRLLFDLPPMHSDVGLVFGQGVYSLLLVPAIAKGFQQGRYKEVIISGGVQALQTSDASLLVKFFQSAGVKQENLPCKGELEADYIARLLPPALREKCTLELQGTNTGENVEFSKPLGLQDAGSITVVCAASMVARTIGTLRKHFADPIQKPISSMPVYPPGINAQNWTAPQNKFAANSMTSEFSKLPKYQDAGFIVPVNLEAERAAIAQSGLAINL